MPVSRKRRPRGSGKVRQLPSGRWQAKVLNSDGIYHSAPVTFDTRYDAEAWLGARNREVAAGTFTPPSVKPAAAVAGASTDGTTLRDYSARWLDSRPLKPRTVVEYRGMLDRHILPDLGDAPIRAIGPDTIRTWHATICPDAPSTRAKAYSLLKTILATATDDDLIDRNPCRIKGAGTAKRQTHTEILAPEQVAVLADAMPEHLRAAIVLGTWTSLRLGEVLGIRRRDIDLDAGTVTVRQTAVVLPGGPQIGTPKSDAGRRVVYLPPHAAPVLSHHLDVFTGAAGDALLFPARRSVGVPMSPSTFYKRYYVARAAIGRPDLRFHDLRHSGATWTAQAGATLGELMARLGHTSPSVAMRYQHAASERDQRLAEALSGLAGGGVSPLRAAGKKNQLAAQCQK